MNRADLFKAIFAACEAYDCGQSQKESTDKFLASLRANGFAVVPVEPSDDMLFALGDEWESYGKRTMRDNYVAMLAAAQENDYGR